MAELSPNTLVVSYAAGAAQILSSWVKSKALNDNFLYCLDGPALQIFQRKLGNMKFVSLDKIQNLNPAFDQVVTGTGWDPDLERLAVKLAKGCKLRTSSVIDHWKNYRERFLPNENKASIPEDWHYYLPDEVWVSDDYAYAHALEVGIPKFKLRRIENAYFSDFQRAYDFKCKMSTSSAPLGKIQLLYVTEPIAEQHETVYGDRNYLGYNEFDLIKALIDAVTVKSNKFEFYVRVRLHPNEHADKYNNLLEKRNTFEVSKQLDLVDDMVWADIVVGADSMALVLGVLAGKRVFSVIPIGGRECTLPHKEIKHCKTFLEVIEAI